MNKSSILWHALPVAFMAMAATASATPAKIRQKNVSLPTAIEQRATVKKAAMNAVAQGKQLDFTVKGLDATTVVSETNFNDGKIPAGWTVDPTSYVTWTVKVIAESGDRSFSNYDPDDKGSLYVEGPYQTYRRENSSVTTAPVEIPANATFNGYIGFSLNYDDECRLAIEVSTDNFTDDITRIWYSADATGERPWAWRPIAADLSDYAGKTVRFRLTYCSGGKDNFDTGGYMGDFAIDGLSIRTSAGVEKLNLVTGEEVTFVPMTDIDAAEWHWSFPGAVPATSELRNPTVYYTADGTYDVSLEVKDSEGNTSATTKTAFVNVTGTAPVAKIGLPAEFRLTSTRLPMIAPTAPVTYTDASDGFPTEHVWSFSGVEETPQVITTMEGDSVEVRYAYLHNQTVELTSTNMHGTSTASAEVSVEYSGTVTNFRPTDAATVFDLEGSGEFPGTNSMKITAYAEKFSKPSRPIMVEGAYVYFMRAEAEELIDQLANIGVHIYTSENGLPGKRLDSWWWCVYELDLPSGSNLVGTAFPFTECPVINDEFFIVVDGLPAKNETCTVSFAMADFRAEGNTAYFLKDGEWKAASDYFPAGKNHTSYLIQPSIIHSVISNLPMYTDPTLHFDKEGGNKEYDLFSYMGYETPVCGDNWVRVISEPNGLTVDQLIVQADPLPAGVSKRETTITLTDGVDSFVIPVVQDMSSGIEQIASGDALTVAPAVFTATLTVMAEAATDFTVTDIAGVTVFSGCTDANGTAVIDTDTWRAGMYIIHTPTSATKALKK
ncbi:MAG: PKD domain-containing protein [Muribaculaceae bacterium]|nr:PKD domain-containing protein [Muribaculaceae bacterium]